METYLARLTPVGRAAMATLALRGPHAWAVVRPLFQRPLPEQPEMGRFWLGRLGDGAAADEVVLSVKQGEPRPWVEIHCHGGGEVVRLLEETLVQRGVLACSWEEWEQHFTTDLARTQAQIALAHAPTTRTAAILLDQYHGAWASEWRTIRALRAENLAEARQRLARLARLVPLGRHLTVPWRVVIAGAPNVGKSSLINALAGYRRSVVAPTPGTTRDVVTTTLAIDGWPVEVADTAGWRDATEDLEREGIARANAAARQADLRLWVLDAATTPKFPQNGEEKWHFVINKIDLPAAWNLAEVAALRVSAVRGDGLGELCQAIGQWLVPEAPPPGAAVPFTPELCDAVERLADCRTPLGDL